MSSPRVLTGNSTAPPPLPARSNRSSKSLPDIGDFEAKFRFHSPRDLPPPDPYVGNRKTYPSSLTASQPRESPPPPPPPRRQLPSLPAR